MAMDHLTPRQAHDFLAAEPSAVFIDCRSEMEFLFVGHPLGAMMIPWNDGPDWEINPHFIGQVKKAVGHATHRPVVLICRSGNRSTDAGEALEAAGFSQLPATTADQDARLKTLPALKLGYYDDQNGAKHYWLADPDFCKCLFHGDEASYQRFENIKLENQVAERDRHAVEMQQQQQQMMMGPPGFGPPGIGFGGGSGGFGFSGGGIGFSF